jgi:uncharacterized membrane protein
MPEETLVRLEDAIPDYHIQTSYYLKAGWELFKQDVVGFVGFSVVALIVILALNKLPGLGQVLTYVVGPPLWAGFLIVALKRRLNQPTEVNDFAKGFAYLVPLLLYSVVSSIFISVGLMLLILPGIYLMVGYLFTTWLIIDRKLDFWPAMELSRKTMHRRFFEVFGFLLILGLVNIAGLLALGLGLLVTFPYTMCVLTVAYQDIFGIRSTTF